jgi:hypothetical protein
MYSGNSSRSRHRHASQLYSIFCETEQYNEHEESMETASTSMNDAGFQEFLEYSESDNDSLLDDFDFYFCSNSESDTDEDFLEIPPEERSAELIIHEWSIKCNIADTAVSELLKDLKCVVPSITITSASSLHKKFQVPSVELDTILLSTGSYVHFGLTSSVQKTFVYDFDWPTLNQSKIVNIQLACDGINIFKSSSTCFWPIMGKYVFGPNLSPFCVGLYCGVGKPDIVQYLSSLVEEMKQLDQGFMHNGIHYVIVIDAFIADAPARSMLKGTKSFSGYYGCDYCHDKGKHEGHKIVFSKTSGAIRKADEFTEFDHNHQLSVSPLLGIMSFEHCFPPEYMHSICLGVIRRMLFIWCKSNKKYPSSHRLTSALILKLDEKLIEAGKMLPIEFHRKARSLKELDRWKATECRQFLLYLGPYVLNGILPTSEWKHFLILHTSVYILCCNSLSYLYSLTFPVRI